jgi:hypothetical protein
VHFGVALRAYLEPAAGTFRKLAAFVGLEMVRLDPLTTLGCGAVYAIPRVVLLISSIPQHLKLDIEQLVHMLQWNVVFGAAFGRHMRRIFDRHLKHSLQAFVAHPMAARQLGGFRGGHIIRTTCETPDESD